MKQKYLDLTHELCVRSAMNHLDHKWHRGDHILLIEKYAGISKSEIWHQEAHDMSNYKAEAAEAIGYELEERITEYLETGDLDCLDLEPVKIRQRVDGSSGKVRNIALLDSMHQMIGHVVYNAIAPMLRAKLLPWQHASIPGRGQTKLKAQAARILRSNLGVKYAVKADIHKAYESTSYQTCLKLLKRDLPSATWIHRMVEAMGELAPDGHLIIGGYLDSWLFNYVMADVLRYMLSLVKHRRGEEVHLCKAMESYMDDVAIFGGRLADLKRALRLTGRWMEPLGLRWKESFTIIRFASIKEERRRKSESSPARRACPGLDMGGYVIHRSYITIRRRTFRSIRRSWLRAAKRAKHGLAPSVARRMLAYYGPMVQSDSQQMQRRYNVASLRRVAVAAVRFDARRAERERKEYLRRYA